MQDKKTTLTYKFFRWWVKFLYPKITVEGAENLPNEPCLIIGNHSQNNGPISCEFYLPGSRYIWCAAEMTKLREVPAYAFSDFWSNKPKRSQWYYKICSYLIAPLSVCVFNGAHTIPVYHDGRAISAFRSTVKHLQAGDNVVVFPERNVKHNHIVYDFQDKFIDVARLYYKKTGKDLSFVPLYIAPRLKKMYLCKPIRFNSQTPANEERQRIKEYLMREITETAVNLPEHTVVPYRNIPRKDYPTNKGFKKEDNK